MKLTFVAFCSAMLTCATLFAEEKIPTFARVIGEIPDGTPPPPEPPKPEFIVPAKDILESKTYQQGGRKITVQRITPIALPEPAKQEPAITPSTPAIRDMIEEFVEENPDAGFLFVGASVYRSKDSSPRTFVNLWPQAQGEGVGFWSSADFALLSGFSSFIGSDGKSRSIIMAWDNQEVTSLEELGATPENEDGLPKLPTLTADKATFSVTSAKPSAEALAAIQSLHDLYNNEQPRLQAAYEGRERALLLQEAELKANPPKPKDIVLSFWRTESPALTEKEATR